MQPTSCSAAPASLSSQDRNAAHDFASLMDLLVGAGREAGFDSALYLTLVHVPVAVVKWRWWSWKREAGTIHAV